jgi:hypothetical protein
VNALTSRIVAALTVASGAAVLLGPVPVSVTGGLLLAFVLPGLALIGVLFRRRELTTVERSVLTPALSMGVLIVAGLVINLVQVRIDRVSWTVSTVAVTLIALLISRRTTVRPATVPVAKPADDSLDALFAGDDTAGEDNAPRPVGEKQVRIDVGEHTVRLPARSAGDGDTVLMSVAPVAADPPSPVPQQRGRLVKQLLPLVVVALILGGASWISFATSRTTHNTTVTALSAAPSGPVTSGGTRTVQVSASGLIAGDGPYTVRVSGSSGRTALERTVAVTGDGTWTERLTLPGAQRLTVNLYRAGDTTAYRTLFISAVD